MSLFAALLFWPGVGTLAGTETCTYLTCCPTTGTIDVDVMANTTCDPTGLGTDCPGSAVCDHTVDILTSNYRITLTGSCASAVRRMLVCQAWVDVQTSMAVCGPTCSEVNELTNGAGNNTPTTRASLTCDPGYAGTFKYVVFVQDNTGSNSCTCSQCGDACCVNDCLVCCNRHAVDESCQVVLN